MHKKHIHSEDSSSTAQRLTCDIHTYTHKMTTHDIIYYVILEIVSKKGHSAFAVVVDRIPNKTTSAFFNVLSYPFVAIVSQPSNGLMFVSQQINRNIATL